MSRDNSGCPPHRTRKVDTMAAKAQDFTAIFKDMTGAFPVDTKAMEEQFKNQTALAEKMSSVAIDAAGKSAELSAKWTQDTLAKVEAMSKAKAEPADYAKAMTDFASASAETAATVAARPAVPAACGGRSDPSPAGSSPGPRRDRRGRNVKETPAVRRAPSPRRVPH